MTNVIECIPDSTKLSDPSYGNFLGLLERKFKETIFGKVTPTRLLHKTFLEIGLHRNLEN